ncbi:MAG: imidazoleglycerol-phosphate dehydratase HisB [SAR324 cluster bacterium]|jgi:imidazoleglycerol-phosphate dehydratase|uniref:Imidazoleglycerol-phosphate dehydratase n=1 Tax=marine metagenome TaxID=408172 RepID=A0A381QP34_9ZZZZ|nr:imidazoleglycerol-phosphate dehydratase HisB [SAR324 cluster bacterium]MCS5545875.1 imidazoleglycerol-phosphate dehydratase HisB [SAR324 cluster bacterium]|tara:strand:- start:790 stop:1383 length:594 start_codon:yes stop_codon:yes gene_type:complete
MKQKRVAKIERITNETKIKLELNLDGSGKTEIKTGIGFLDHMLNLWAFHGLFDLKIKCSGDLEIDAHHTTEDIAIVLGSALAKAVGEKKGISRYGHAYVPMDEALIRAALDLSGRSEFVFSGEFSQQTIGQLDTQMITHFFRSLAMSSGMTLHMVILYGINDHHKCEGLFKALGRALRVAVELDPRRTEVVSTKGTL